MGGMVGVGDSDRVGGIAGKAIGVPGAGRRGRGAARAKKPPVTVGRKAGICNEYAKTS